MKQTATKATIKRASAKARRDMNRLDAETLDALKKIYRRTVDDIRQDIEILSQGNPTLRLEHLQILLNQTEKRLTEIEQAKAELLQAGMTQAAKNGTAPLKGAVDQIILNNVSESSIRFVREFQAADGLQLSDRIWRVDQGARDAVRQSIQRSVILGDDASRAAQEFLKRGLPVPAATQAAINAAAGSAIAGQIGRDLLHDKNSAYRHTARVFRTEINRTHIESYRGSAFSHPDTIGTRFLLSPNHPEPDICDMHARVNRYGLGKGVYPKGKSPLPAHPNTLSYEEIVFNDEVTYQDKNDQEDRISFLNKQPPYLQEKILGGNAKRVALENGLLKENQINTPWHTLRLKYAKQGANITGWENLPPKKVHFPPGAKRPVSKAIDVLSEKGAANRALAAIDSVHDDGRLPTLPVLRSSNQGYLGAYIYHHDGTPHRIDIDRFGDHKELTAAHEFGHFIDHYGIGKPGEFASVKLNKMQGWRNAINKSEGYASLMAEQKASGGPRLRYVNYLLDKRELWARSYAQYIANKSQDPFLLEQLNRTQKNAALTQWDDEDFEPIANEIDKLFKELGWIN